MTEPVVTIATVCRGVETHLPQTVESVLNQDYPQIEYIVVDCVSSLDHYGDRLEMVSAPNLNLPHALNQALHQARGQIFGVLPVGDLYAENSITTVVQTFSESPDAALVYGEADWIDEHDKLI